MQLDNIKLFITEALRLLNSGVKEDVMTSNFVSYLRQMFPDSPQWVNHYVSGIETSVSLYRHNSVTTGSIDVFIDGTVIEFEKDLSSTYLFHHGKDQVKEYCASRIRSGANIGKLIGVLSDTLNWYFYKVQEVPGLPIANYGTTDVNLILLKEIHITKPDDNSAIELKNCLNEYLGRMGARPLTADYLKEDFGIDSYWGKHYLSEAKSFIESLESTKPAYASLIHTIWAHFVEGIDLSIDTSTGSYEYEFYIATLAKLLCANIIKKQAVLSNDDELVDIISGDYFQRQGYVNFVEYDYFGWINEHLSSSNYLLQLKKTQQDLAIYDYTSIPEEDIFGRLLSQLSIKTKRVLLGQELTPSWLSNAVVNNVAQKLPEGTWPRFIDMCCGSGSMLISTINYCSSQFINKALSDSEKFDIISTAAMGIDIDPLAVLLAKINWIIHTEQYCKNRTDIIIPVYHADSLFISSPVSTNPTSYLLNLDGNIVKLPRFLLDSDFYDFFPLLIEKIAKNLDTTLTEEDYKHIVHESLEYCGLSVEQEEELDISSFAFNLYLVLQDLHKRDRNGIWAFLIKNSFKPALISRKFNGIVSNTPWMTLSEVKDNPYKENLTTKAVHYGIKPSGPSFPHLELATVFLIHSIDSYLTDEAIYGCILPRSILKGMQHDPFRSATNFNSSYPFRVKNEEIWDLPEDTFPNRAVVLYGRKNTTASNPFTGRKYNTKDSYSDTQVYEIQGAGRCIWSLDQTDFQPLSPNYTFTQGADILPRPFFYFDLQSRGQQYSISPLVRNTSSYAFFLDDAKVKYEISPSIVPKQYFRKTVVSKVLHPFIISDYPLALIPYKRDPQTGKQRVFSDAEFAALPTTASSVFRKMKKGYTQTMGGNKDLYGDKVLNLRNKLTNQKFIVGKYLILYGAGGSNVAAAYTPITPSNADIIVDQTLYYKVVDYEPEAIFITGLLNSDVLSEAITTYQPSGIFGERHIHTLPRYFIPAFDRNNKNHSDFVSATKSLIDELSTRLSNDSTIQNLINPNNSTLSSRRKRLLVEIHKLESFTEFDSLSRLIII